MQNNCITFLYSTRISRLKYRSPCRPTINVINKGHPTTIEFNMLILKILTIYKIPLLLNKMRFALLNDTCTPVGKFSVSRCQATKVNALNPTGHFCPYGDFNVFIAHDYNIQVHTVTACSFMRLKKIKYSLKSLILECHLKLKNTDR